MKITFDMGETNYTDQLLCVCVSLFQTENSLVQVVRPSYLEKE